MKIFTLAAAFACLTVLGLACRSEADQRSDFERDLEAGRVDEANRTVGRPSVYRGKAVPKGPASRWLECAKDEDHPGLVGTWGNPKDLGVAFPAPQVTQLADGTLLVTGGRNPEGRGSLAVGIATSYGAARVFGPMPMEAGPHLAFPSKDGSVFLGQAQGGGFRLLRLWPETGRWEALPSPRSGWAPDEARGALLPDGRVLMLVATRDPKGRTCAQVFDPVGLEWSITKPLPFLPSRGTVTWLGEGRLLLCGGWDAEQGGNLDRALIFDPGKGWFRHAGSMGTSRRNHTATLLPTGLVLVAGGYDATQELATTEIFDPATRSFRAGPSLPFPMARHAARLLKSGQVLLTAGAATVVVDGWTLEVRTLRSPEAIGVAEPSDALSVWRENPALAVDVFGTPWMFGGTGLRVGSRSLDGQAAQTAAPLH